MNDIYLNPNLYDALHSDIGTDENVIKYYAKKCNGPVLEIACGTGRLSKYIIDLGLPYTGIDNSCLLYTSPSPRDRSVSRMPSSA